MPSTKVTPKAEETGLRILDSALALFRQEGFDTATMRDIAEKAGVATGAAYYYYPSKDAIVMDFYQRSCAEMQPKIEAALEEATGLEPRLRELIRVKLAYFAPNRGVLRALLRNGADPKHPLSPFSPGRSGTSTSPGFAAFWSIAACGFRAISNLICPACSGSFRWA
jgi:AcrR family transcriptional regulator